MTEYRGRLRGVPLDRPLQCISNSLQVIENWAAAVLLQHPKGTVEFLKSEEVLIGVKHGKGLDTTSCINCEHSVSHHLMTSSTSNKKLGACSAAGCECKCYVRRSGESL